MAGPLVRQEDATEADQPGQRHSDFTNGVHVLPPTSYHRLAVIGLERFGRKEIGSGSNIGEKQEQSKNKKGLLAQRLAAGPRLPFGAAATSGMMGYAPLRA
jgi:hypothetical protein